MIESFLPSMNHVIELLSSFLTDWKCYINENCLDILIIYLSITGERGRGYESETRPRRDLPAREREAGAFC